VRDCCSHNVRDHEREDETVSAVWAPFVLANWSHAIGARSAVAGVTGQSHPKVERLLWVKSVECNHGRGAANFRNGPIANGITRT
jgi:hypothetical protein